MLAKTSTSAIALTARAEIEPVLLLTVELATIFLVPLQKEVQVEQKKTATKKKKLKKIGSDRCVVDAANISLRVAVNAFGRFSGTRDDVDDADTAVLQYRI